MPRSFSLRALLLAVTLMALGLGYYMNWIHQRHAFLAQQFELYVAAAPAPVESERREWVSAWRGKTVTNLPAPWPLRLFGENGVGGLSIIVPESDITMRTWGYDESGVPVQWPEISASRGVYRRAKRLFPEAKIAPLRSKEWTNKYRGGERTNWLQPLVIYEQAREARVRLVCDRTVIEGNSLVGKIEATAPSDSCVSVEHHTCGGTATAQQGNFVELGDTIVFPPHQSKWSSSHAFILRTDRLTEEQRAAGGATFKIKLGTVIGAVADVTEKTVTILPRKE